MENKFTDEQTSSLLNAWEKGMTKSESGLVPSVCQETGLKTEQVKGWIGNHRRNVNGRKRKRAKARQPSCYNAFCKEQSKVGTFGESSKEWAKKWKLLTPSQKKVFKEKAQSEELTNSPQRSLQTIRKKISMCFDELTKLGVEGYCLLLQPDSSLTVLGTAKGLSFTKDESNLAVDFAAFLQLKKTPSLATNSDKTLRKECLRKEVQRIFSTKYKQCFGEDISYTNPGIALDGLPKEMRFKKPSSYGPNNLQLIVDNETSIRLRKITNDDVGISAVSGQSEPLETAVEDFIQVKVPVESSVDVIVQQESDKCLDTILASGFTPDLEYVDPEGDAPDVEEVSSVSSALEAMSEGRFVQIVPHHTEETVNAVSQKKRASCKKQIKKSVKKAKQESDKYEIQTVLESKTIKRRKTYLVHWKGYPKSEATWQHLPKAIAKYYGF